MRLVPQIGIYLPQLFRERLAFGPSDVAQVILLALDVGEVYSVEVRQHEPPDAEPRQKHCDMRAEAAEPRDAHRSLGEDFLILRAVTQRERSVNLLLAYH